MMAKQKNKTWSRLKILAWYELLASTIVIIVSVYSFIKYNFLSLNFFIAIFGIIGGFTLLKNTKAGWLISIFWAVVQTFKLKIGMIFLNFSQFFQLNFFLDFRPVSDLRIYVNFLGIILTFLLLKWRKEIK